MTGYYARRSLGAWVGAVVVLLGGAMVADWFNLSEFGGIVVMGVGIALLAAVLYLRQFYARRHR